MKRLLSFLLAIPIAIIAAAQDQPKLNVQELLETKNFVFKAESVNPARGRYRQLTSEYDVVVTPDTITTFLPYFGRAYSAPINPADGGIKITTLKFDYSIKKGKKDRWDISVRPNDSQEVQDLFFTVFSNGRATLRVNSVNRETITFNGYIVEGKARKKAF
jgi:hypothetical protein